MIWLMNSVFWDKASYRKVETGFRAIRCEARPYSIVPVPFFCTML